MKNIYELETKEKDKLRGEFNKLEFAKRNITASRVVLFLVGLLFVACAVLSELVDGNADLKNIYNLSETLLYVTIIISVMQYIYLSVAFIRWVKIKHNIEY